MPALPHRCARPARATQSLRLHAAFALLLATLFSASAALADAVPAERVVWRKVPIQIPLSVGVERRIHFPEAVELGIPPQFRQALRVQSIAGVVYLLAQKAFPETRVLVRSLDEGRVYVLDITADAVSKQDAPGRDLSEDNAPGHNAPIEVHLPEPKTTPGDGHVHRENVENIENAQGRADAPGTYGYVALTRFAAQHLYAPARLHEPLPGVVRVPIAADPVDLLRGGTTAARPLIAWRAGAVHLTAVLVINQTPEALVLDPRELRGQWLTATFQHNRLQAAGTDADRTVLYLTSQRPFAASLP